MMEMIDYSSSNRIANPYVVKCVLLGDTGIGKSTLLNVFKTGHFDNTIESTIGIDFASKNITLPDYNNQQLKLQIWDTAGSGFRSIIKSYLRDVYIAFLIFDLTDRDSWNNLEQWKKELQDDSKYELIPLLVLVGTKSDLKDQIVISEDEIKSRSSEWECNYKIISSKYQNSYTIISNMFSMAAENLHQLIVYKHINGKELPNNIYEDEDEYINDHNSGNKNGCCIIN